MKIRFAIVDFGMGNIGSVLHAMQFLGAQIISSKEQIELKEAQAYILPGVGAFPKAMENIKKLKLDSFLNEQILGKKKPVLGICLGMQLMADSSDEDGKTEGLRWINGSVKKLNAKEGVRIPHVGWNSLSNGFSGELFNNFNSDPHFYFDHSFHFVCSEKKCITSTCTYGSEIVASLQKENIYATQFHPEKSQRAGLKLLRNFINQVESIKSR